MFWGARGTVRRVAEPGRKVPGAARPSRRADRPGSIPGMRQAPDSPPSPVVFDGLRGRTGIRSRTGKPQHPAFPVSRPLLFQSSPFEDTPRMSLPYIVFLRELSRPSASAGLRIGPLQAAGS